MRIIRFVLVLLALPFTVTAHAASFSGFYIFGDSLSDTRPNIGTSNGPLWPQYLAPALGLTFDPTHNFARAGALAGEVKSQVTNFGAMNPTIDPDALYVVWGGANDLLNSLSLVDAVSRIVESAQALADRGAQHVTVMNLPDLGLTPHAISAGIAPTATKASMLFNAQLAKGLSGTGVSIFDVFSLHRQVILKPDQYGFTNVRDPCRTVLGDSACQSPNNTYFYWDSIHPMTQGHEILANQLHAAVVPLPASLYLLCVGALLLMRFGRLRTN